jgi:type III pantothenate kinase
MESNTQNTTLLVDIGNSNIKLRIDNNNQIISLSDFNKQILPAHTRAIISDVSASNLYTQFNNPILIKAKAYKDLKFNYDLSQLGVDRYLAIIATYELFGADKALIIDIGSAITIDKIENRIHTSLGIAPGLLRLRSTFSFNGKESKTAFDIGTLNMLKDYILSTISRHSKYQTIITGGGQELINISDKNINYKPNLVLDGLKFYTNYFLN